MKDTKGNPSAMRVKVSVLVEVDATELFAGENVNWQYCKERATFVHRDDDACEFILHVGDGHEGNPSHATSTITDMESYGCTQASKEKTP